MTTLTAGRLRHRVQIQENTGTRNAHNEIIDSWTNLTGGSRWAEVRPLRGDELTHAKQLHAKVTHQVTIRALSTVTPAMRVVYDSRNLYVRSVIDTGELGVEMVLTCGEVL